MREMTVEESKQCMLDLLIDFHQFCEKNNLTYFLSSGTLIGAVRHKGFIPWDDDLDVMMPFPDYERFIELSKNSGLLRGEAACYEKNPKYTFFTCRYYDKKTLLDLPYFSFGDVMGIHISIFPIYGIGSDYGKAVKLVNSLQKYKKLRVLANNKHFIKPIRLKFLFLPKLILFYFLKLIPLNDFLQRRVRKVCLKYNYEKSAYVGTISGRYGIKKIMRKEVFASSVDLEFEKHLFKAPVLFDELLRQIYGDYMTPPPENECIKPHTMHPLKIEE